MLISLKVFYVSCEINLLSNWWNSYVITTDTENWTLAITDTKLFVPAVSL